MFVQAGNADIKIIQPYYFDRKDKLGQGSYGTVYLGHLKENPFQNYAIKVVPVSLIQGDPELQENMLNEMKVMLLLSHENIVRCYDVIETANNYYFIMEYCQDGTLGQYLTKYGRLSESEALRILIHILKGYYEMLKLGIIHRDLKPENILINNGVFKIADFGFAKCVENFKKDILKSLVGTPLYMSPQILQGQEYNTKTDMWSIATIYYEMLCGTTPWQAKFHVELINKILSQPITFPKEIKISPESKNFILGCMKIYEHKRFSWEEVLCHPLFQDAFGYWAKKRELNKQALNYQTLLREKIVELNLDLFKLFSEIDKNKNNELEINEFSVLIRKLDKTASREQIEFVFNSIDEDGNNVISLYEFRKWLSSSSNNVIKKSPSKLQKQGSLPYYSPGENEYPVKTNLPYQQNQFQGIAQPKIVQGTALTKSQKQIKTLQGYHDVQYSVTQAPPVFNPPLIPLKPLNAPFNPNLPLRPPGPFFQQAPPPPFMPPAFGYYR